MYKQCILLTYHKPLSTTFSELHKRKQVTGLIHPPQNTAWMTLCFPTSLCSPYPLLKRVAFQSFKAPQTLAANYGIYIASAGRVFSVPSPHSLATWPNFLLHAMSRCASTSNAFKTINSILISLHTRLTNLPRLDKHSWASPFPKLSV